MRRVFISLIGFAFVGLIGFFGSYFLRDEQRIVDLVQEKLRLETGCSLTAVDIDLDLFPTPTLTLGQIRILNSLDYGKRAEILTIAQAKIPISYSALLTGKVNLTQNITLFQPVINKKMQAGCARNRMFFAPNRQMVTPTNKSLDFSFRSPKLTFHLINGTATLAIPAYAGDVTLEEINGYFTFTLDKKTLNSDFTTKIMAEEFTIAAAHRLSDTTQIVEITAQHGQNGKIALTGKRPLEAKKDTPKFWRGTLGIDDFANIAGLRQTSPPQTHFNANFQTNNDGVTFTDLDLRIPGAKFGGLITYMTQSKNKLDMTLLAQQLNLDSMIAAIPLQHQNKADDSNAPIIDQHPVKRIGMAWRKILQRAPAEISLNFTADQVIWQKTLFQNLSTNMSKVAGQNQPLSLNDLRLDLPRNGKLQAQFTPIKPSNRTQLVTPQDKPAKGRAKGLQYYQGSVTLSGADFRAMLALTGHQVTMKDPNRLRQFSLKAGLKWDEKRLEVQNISGQLDQIAFRGGIFYVPNPLEAKANPNSQRPTLGIALALNQFSPLAYSVKISPKPNTGISSAGDIDQTEARQSIFWENWRANLTLNSRVKIGKLDLGQFTASHFEMASSWQQDKLFIQELNIENLQGGPLKGESLALSGMFSDFSTNPNHLPSLALSGQFRPYTNPASLKNNKATSNGADLDQNNTVSNPQTYKIKLTTEPARLQLEIAKSGQTSAMRLDVDKINLVQKGAEFFLRKNHAGPNQWLVSGLLNWHDDVVAIREGRLIMPKLSPNIADFSWSGRLSLQPKPTLIMQTHGSFHLPFTHDATPLNLSVSGGDISDLSLIIHPKKSGPAGYFLDFEAKGAAKLSTQWQMTSQPEGPEGPTGMVIQNVRDAQNWIAQHYVGRQDFDVTIAGDAQSWQFQARHQNSADTIAHLHYKIGPTDARQLTLSIDRGQTKDYITFAHTAHHKDSRVKIGGAWLKKQPNP